VVDTGRWVAGVVEWVAGWVAVGWEVARAGFPVPSADRRCHPRINMRLSEHLPSLPPRLSTALRLNNPSIRVWVAVLMAVPTEVCAGRWICAPNRAVVAVGYSAVMK
jgi:hypothetical protein